MVAGRLGSLIVCCFCDSARLCCPRRTGAFVGCRSTRASLCMLGCSAMRFCTVPSTAVFGGISRKGGRGARPFAAAFAGTKHYMTDPLEKCCCSQSLAYAACCARRSGWSIQQYRKRCKTALSLERFSNLECSTTRKLLHSQSRNGDVGNVLSIREQSEKRVVRFWGSCVVVAE